MLKLEFKIPEMGYNQKKMYSDIENEIRQMKVKDTLIVRRLIEEIEKGKYCDQYSFIDRFGFKIFINNMSTGCRAALLMATNPPSYAVDLSELGLTAQDAIIRNCKEGHILVPERRDLTFDSEFYTDPPIDVEFDGFRFDSIRRLSNYIHNDFLFTDAEDIIEAIESGEEYGIAEIPGAKHLTIRGQE